jgi:succinoglycan biosynthesis transport protein ExoP
MTLQFPAPKLQNEPESKGSGRKLQPLQSLKQHAKLALLVGFIILLAGAPVAWIKGEAKYKAEGVLFVSPRFLRNLDTDQEHELQSNSQYREFVQQQVRTVNRYDIVAEAMKAGGFWQNKGESTRRATDRLRGAMQILPVPDTYQVTVSLEGDKPQGLAELVNAVMQSYVKTAHKELLFDSEKRLQDLAEEKQRLEADIDALIEERTSIASDLGTTVFSGAMLNSYDRQLGSSSEAVTEARRQRFVAEAALSGGTGTKASALQNALSDNSLNGFKSALNTRKAELMVSISGLSAQHVARLAAEREIKAIDLELESVTAALRDRLASNLETINRSRLEQSTRVEANLQHETQKIRENAEAYSRSYQHSLELGEEIGRARKRLHATEDRISYLQLETRAPGFVRIFAPAMTPDLPIQGGRKKLFLMVLAAAVAIALILPLGIDYVDPRLRAPQELEMHLGLPISGWLPNSATMDSPSLLRTAVSIRRHVHELRRRVIVATALDHGGGSSSVSIGLANALNRLGLRTLLIEANPLTPDPRYQCEHSEGGLIPWLKGDLADLPLQAANSDLPDRVATGTGTIEDLLPVERLESGLKDLLDRWDLILIDAAPLPRSLATEELVRIFGSALLVVDAQRDKKAAVTGALEILERLAPKAFGAVLNKVGLATQLQFSAKDKNDTPSVLAA